MNETKPRLRGVLHQWGAVVAVAAGAALVLRAPSTRAMIACVVFAASHVVQLTVSALYHRIDWSTSMRAHMRRADHAMIFVLIAGSATPFALLSMPADLGAKLLWLFWGGAALGFVLIVAWPSRPKWLFAGLCVALGWAGAPTWLDERGTLDVTTVTLLSTSGVLYSIGAACYALKRPKLWPATFSYHELFHALTIVAAIVNFAAAARVAWR